MGLRAFLLDLDGTLIDSNDLHVEAWLAALERHGYRVARDRIAVEMGKGGDHLVPDVLGADAEKHHGEALRAAHDAFYAELAPRRGIPVLPGARQLLSALEARGLTTALVTSSGRSQLEIAERASGVAWSDLVDEVICGDDAERSKPSPDLVTVALHTLALSAAQCAMLGDTPWDANAARKAGVVTLGLLTGGNTRAVLRRAGARQVYRDPDELHAHLDDALRTAAPASADLDAKLLAHLMREALRAAEEGLRRGEAPIGCVLARGDGTIVARGHNRFIETGDKARHAEIDAFANAAGKLGTGRDAILVSTLEPCVMCTGAAMETAIDVIVYGLPAPADGGTSRVTPPESDESQLPRAVGRVLAAEARDLFVRWLAQPGRDPMQVRYVKQLLEATSAPT